jgi:hypothetical protein
VKLLLLGGPRFLGRAVADAALERTHELTFFNRGRSNPELFPEVEKLAISAPGWSSLANEASETSSTRRTPGVSWSELLESCRGGTDADVEITWLPDDFLVDHGVTARELPMWFPEPAMAGANDAVVDRALAAGLPFRLVDDTVRGAFEDAPMTETAGLTPEREAGLLEAWHARG